MVSSPTTSRGRLHYADYKPLTTSDGEGFRSALYVSGCTFKCQGCWNQLAQSFLFGKPYTLELQRQILEDIDKPYVRGLSILGGEPFQNQDIVLPLVQEFQAMFGNTKDIWCWTGFTLGELQELDEPLLQYIDVLVDGQFIEAQRDLSLDWRGSRNQTVWRKDIHGTFV